MPSYHLHILSIQFTFAPSETLGTMSVSDLQGHGYISKQQEVFRIPYSNMRAQADATRQSNWDSVSGCGGRRSAVTDWHMLALYLSPENGLLYRDSSVLKRPRDLHLSCFSLSISSHLAFCSISLLLLLSSKTATSPLGEAVTPLETKSAVFTSAKAWGREPLRAVLHDREKEPNKDWIVYSILHYTRPGWTATVLVKMNE